MTQSYPNGGGASLGHWLAVNKNTYLSGNFWYVHNTLGTDAASPAGQDRRKPLATIAQAFTNGATMDVIVLMDGHTETFTTSPSLGGKAFTIIGEGSSGGEPTVQLNMNAANARTFIMPTAGTRIGNIKFSNLQANSLHHLDVGATGITIEDCLFNLNDFDNDAPIVVGGSGTYCRIARCTFKSVSTSTSTQPNSAIRSSGAANGLTIEDCVVDGGEFGFSRFHAVDLSATNFTGLSIKNLTLKNGADVKINASTTGHANIPAQEGSARVEW